MAIIKNKRTKLKVTQSVEPIDLSDVASATDLATLSDSVLKIEKTEYVQAGVYTCTISNTRLQNVIFEIEYVGYNSTWTGFIYGKSVFGLPLIHSDLPLTVYDIVSNEDINVSAAWGDDSYVITIDSLPAAAWVTIKSNQ